MNILLIIKVKILMFIQVPPNQVEFEMVINIF